MEGASRGLSGAKDSRLSSTSGGGADKDKDIDSHSNKSEDDEHSGTLSHSTDYTLSSNSEGDPGYSNESSEEELLSESEGTVAISAPQTVSRHGAKHSGRNKKKTVRYYANYLDRMSVQE